MFTSYTLANLAQMLADRTDQSPYWTGPQAQIAINEALRVYNLLTGVWKQRIVLTTTPGTIWYTLPSTLVYRVRIEFNSHPLDPGSTHELDNGRPGWEAHTTATGGPVPSTVKLWIPKGLNLLGIYPADAAGSNSLSIDGVRRTPVLASGSDTLNMSRSEKDAILAYALHALSFSAGGQIFASTEVHYKNFITFCATQNPRLLQSNFFRGIMGLDLKRQEEPFKVESK